MRFNNFFLLDFLGFGVFLVIYLFGMKLSWDRVSLENIVSSVFFVFYFSWLLFFINRVASFVLWRLLGVSMGTSCFIRSFGIYSTGYVVVLFFLFSRLVISLGVVRGRSCCVDIIIRFRSYLSRSIWVDLFGVTVAC